MKSQKKNQNAMDRYSLTNLKNHFDISKNMKLKRKCIRSCGFSNFA